MSLMKCLESVNELSGGAIWGLYGGIVIFVHIYGLNLLINLVTTTHMPISILFTLSFGLTNHVSNEEDTTSASRT